MRYRFLGLAFLIASIAIPAIAQQSETEAEEQPDWVEESSGGNGSSSTVPSADWIPLAPEGPERTVPDEAELHFLTRNATAGGQAQRVAAIRRIQELVSSGRFHRSDPELIELLSRVALEPTIVRRRGAPPTGYPIARMHAVQALSMMNGSEVRTTLIRVLRNDQEPAVLTEAMRALAALRPYPDSELSATIVQLIQRVPRSDLDGRLGLSILDATLALDSVGAGIQSQDLYRELVRLALHSGSSRVRSRAYEVIDTLRNKGRRAPN